MNHKADWLGWSLQLVVGLVVGAVGGLKLVQETWRHCSIWGEPTSGALILGAAFIGGALASYYGDRLWIGQNYRIIPPDGTRHSRTSRMASISIGLLGIVLLGWTYFREICPFEELFP